jgi:predicted TIM-barrel fold metal-dependent hydrolase
MTAAGTVVDTSAYPFFRSNVEFREYLPAAFKYRGIPDVHSTWYQAAGGDYHESTYGDGYPGSDPETLLRHLVEEGGADIVILNPLTRGNLPDYILNSVVCAATNQWLVERWLSVSDRFRGTIRVNPEDVPAAVAEIERWADHPGMVQVGVPLQSREPYGKPQFLPVWEAAASHGLPVAVRATGGAGLDFNPTPAGLARTYPHYVAYFPLNFFNHLASLVTEGVFEKLPDARFVFADGGTGILTPMMWRFDDWWLPHRDRTPWMKDYPSTYLQKHFRFCTTKLDGPFDPELGAKWLELSDLQGLLLHASHYPFWFWGTPGDLPAGITDGQREKVLWQNANDLYRLGVDAEVPSAN